MMYLAVAVYFFISLYFALLLGMKHLPDSWRTALKRLIAYSVAVMTVWMSWEGVASARAHDWTTAGQIGLQLYVLVSTAWLAWRTAAWR